VISPTVLAEGPDPKLSNLPKFSLPSAILQEEASALEIEINPNINAYINNFLK
jgi:hypothetical protein